MNNNRDWFHAHKKQYGIVKKEIESGAAQLIKNIAVFDPPIGQLQPKDCIFRINRDVRFSNDKSPYKTNTGIFFTRGGKKSPFAGYYLHLEPGKSFIGGGVYMPLAPALKAIRTEILYNYPDFIKIISEPGFTRYFNDLADHGRLSRPPKDFPADFDGIEILKNKHFVVGHSLSDKNIVDGNVLTYSTDVFRSMKDFNHFLNEALQDVPA
jgi:uncharacterized protein (TIGR02453 family)